MRNLATQGPEIILEKGRTINIVPGCVNGDVIFVYCTDKTYDVLMKPSDCQQVNIGNRARLATKQLLKRIEQQAMPAVEAQPQAERYGYNDRHPNRAMADAMDRGRERYRSFR